MQRKAKGFYLHYWTLAWSSRIPQARCWLFYGNNCLVHTKISWNSSPPWLKPLMVRPYIQSRYWTNCFSKAVTIFSSKGVSDGWTTWCCYSCASHTSFSFRKSAGSNGWPSLLLDWNLSFSKARIAWAPKYPWPDDPATATRLTAKRSIVLTDKSTKKKNKVSRKKTR